MTMTVEDWITIVSGDYGMPRAEIVADLIRMVRDNYDPEATDKENANEIRRRLSRMMLHMEKVDEAILRRVPYR